MTIHYQGHGVTLHHGDCLDVLRTLPDASVDSVVTDPPYGLEFMGKDWDGADGFRRSLNPNDAGRDNAFGRSSRTSPEYRAGTLFQEWAEAWSRECLRVLKPGGHLLAFGGTRTWHRLACAVEDAGFEVRDSIAWMYGSGFPKSLDVSKAIDKRANVNDETHRRIALVAEVIRTHREAKGMERSAVSLAVVGTPSGACWNWEHQQLPSAEMWPAIKRALDIPDKFDGLIEGTRAQFIGAEREVVGLGQYANRGRVASGSQVDVGDSAASLMTAPATPAAEQWQGFGTALKPGHEPVVCARKPFNTVPLGEEVDRLHHLIGGLLWLSLSPAKRAELASPSSPAGQHGARCASALVSAATATSPDGFAQTGMCSSPATASTSSSIASSWSSILGALSALTSTSTTSTRSSTTTALTTLSSLLAPLTSPSTMPPCACLTSGSSSSAPSAGSDSTDEWARWLHTLSASVPASAIEGTALVVASALAQVAASLSADQGAASSADPSATTGADASPSPAFEPVVVARKPLTGTVAQSVLTHGTGALNIDGCRISMSNEDRAIVNNRSGAGFGTGDTVGANQGRAAGKFTSAPAGRWPANVVLDESQAAALDEQSGDRPGDNPNRKPRQNTAEAHNRTVSMGRATEDWTTTGHADIGGASRFFYVAKADASERPRVNGTAHPTVKPLDLMRWLVRLVTPPGGTVLEPFAGSGTTVEACIIEGFQCIAIEREADYLPLIRQRIDRRRDPVESLRGQAADLGLFDLLGGEGA